MHRARFSFGVTRLLSKCRDGISLLGYIIPPAREYTLIENRSEIARSRPRLLCIIVFQRQWNKPIIHPVLLQRFFVPPARAPATVRARTISKTMRANRQSYCSRKAARAAAVRHLLRVLGTLAITCAPHQFHFSDVSVVAAPVR